MAFTPQAHESELVALVVPFTVNDPAGQGMQAMLPVEDLKAAEPQTLHPPKLLVASPPYPAEHSHTWASTFMSEFKGHSQLVEEVAFVTSSAMLAPRAQESQPTFPAALLYSRAPHGLHPTAILDASPLYPASHSHRPASAFKTALVPQAHESELVALLTPSLIIAPKGHCVQAMLPSAALKAPEPHAVQPT